MLCWNRTWLSGCHPGRRLDTRVTELCGPELVEFLLHSEQLIRNVSHSFISRKTSIVLYGGNKKFDTWKNRRLKIKIWKAKDWAKFFGTYYKLYTLEYTRPQNIEKEKGSDLTAVEWIKNRRRQRNLRTNHISRPLFAIKVSAKIIGFHVLKSFMHPFFTGSGKHDAARTRPRGEKEQHSLLHDACERRKRNKSRGCMHSCETAVRLYATNR